MPAAVAAAGVRRVAAAIVLALVAGPGLADTAVMRRAIEAASLHDGPLDMVAYYVPAPDGALEVTATFARRWSRVTPGAPMRTVMALADGDDVAFAMPGYPEALYRFRRSGEEVTVSVRPVRPRTQTDPGL
jgi:hypothetical protein